MAVAHLFGQQVECRKRGIGSLHLSKLNPNPPTDRDGRREDSGRG